MGIRVNALVFVAAAGVVLTGCRGSASTADDVARVALETGSSERSVTALLDDVARVSSQESDELARLLATASVPSESAVSRAAAQLESSGIPNDIGRGIVCDTLAAVVLDPEGVDIDSLSESLISNIVAAGGDGIAWAVTAAGIAKEIADGTADNALWARVTLLKLQHCS